MSIYEYSKWDGTQQFLPQSADKVFDQLSEFLLQYGERICATWMNSRKRCPRLSS